MTRSEARQIADELTPQGFRFNSLTLTDSGQWVATFLDDSEPPGAIIERWDDVYTEADPDPDEVATEDDTPQEVTDGTRTSS